MITLFKLIFEMLLTLAVFIGGIKFAFHFPNAAAKLNQMTIDLTKGVKKQ